MSLKNRIKRIYGCTRELMLAPLRTSKSVGEQMYQDGVRIKRSGTTSLVVGGVAAAATLPFRRVLVPAALAARASKDCKTVKGAVTAGFTGVLVGVTMVVYCGEIAILLYVAEAMAWAARADERAQEKELIKQKKAEAEELLAKRKRREYIDPETGEILVGGSVEIGSLSTGL